MILQGDIENQDKIKDIEITKFSEENKEENEDDEVEIISLPKSEEKSLEIIFKKCIKLSVAAGGLSKTNKFNHKQSTHRERVQNIIYDIEKIYGSESDNFDFLGCTDSILAIYDEEFDTLYFCARYTEFKFSKRGLKDIAFALWQRVSFLKKRPDAFPKRFQRDFEFVNKYLDKPEFSKSKIVLTGFSMGGAEAIKIYERLLQYRTDISDDRYLVVAWNPGGFSLPLWIKREKNQTSSKEKDKNIITFQVEGDFLSDFWEKPGLEYRIKRISRGKHSSRNFLLYFFSQKG